MMYLYIHDAFFKMNFKSMLAEVLMVTLGSQHVFFLVHFTLFDLFLDIMTIMDFVFVTLIVYTHR
jgi:hypothetical protein